MALALAVWSPGNEKVIGKIQGLGEAHMAELMRSIEEVMGSMPEEVERDGSILSRRSSPIKSSRPQ